MSNNATLKQNQLGNRLKKASNDLDKIMKDLQRDCKPYWKFTELVMELNDIAHEADVQTKDLARSNKAKQNALARIKRMSEEINKKKVSLQEAEDVL